MFEELMEFNPAGEHLIEYAIFMHRRKKDMSKAETYMIDYNLILFIDLNIYFL
jgi:hypothetical protein